MLLLGRISIPAVRHLTMRSDVDHRSGQPKNGERLKGGWNRPVEGELQKAQCKASVALLAWKYRAAVGPTNDDSLYR